MIVLILIVLLALCVKALKPKKIKPPLVVGALPIVGHTFTFLKNPTGSYNLV